MQLLALCWLPTFTVWKVSNYGVFSGPYFPVFSPNAGKYGPEKTPYLDTFHVVFYQLQNLWFSDVFRGIKKGTLGSKGFILQKLSLVNELRMVFICWSMFLDYAFLIKSFDLFSLVLEMA